MDARQQNCRDTRVISKRVEEQCQQGDQQGEMLEIGREVDLGDGRQAAKRPPGGINDWDGICVDWADRMLVCLSSVDVDADLEELGEVKDGRHPGRSRRAVMMRGCGGR